MARAAQRDAVQLLGGADSGGAHAGRRACDAASCAARSIGQHCVHAVALMLRVLLKTANNRMTVVLPATSSFVMHAHNSSPITDVIIVIVASIGNSDIFRLRAPRRDRLLCACRSDDERQQNGNCVSVQRIVDHCGNDFVNHCCQCWRSFLSQN